MIITGIGSRETPPEILVEMTKIGQWCRENDVVLRSGHAEGADWAFEWGAQRFCTAFLPWNGFNKGLKSEATYVDVSTFPEEKQNILSAVTRQFHPNPSALNLASLKLMNRNVCQLLGAELDYLTDAVVCWTKNGEISGGTGQALRIREGILKLRSRREIHPKLVLMNMFSPEYSTAEKVLGVLTKLRDRMSMLGKETPDNITLFLRKIQAITC